MLSLQTTFKPLNPQTFKPLRLPSVILLDIIIIHSFLPAHRFLQLSEFPVEAYPESPYGVVKSTCSGKHRVFQLISPGDLFLERLIHVHAQYRPPLEQLFTERNGMGGITRGAAL